MGRGESGWWGGRGAEDLFFCLKQICHLMDPKTNQKRKSERKSKSKIPSPKIFFFPGHKLLCFLSHFNININTMCSLKLVPL